MKYLCALLICICAFTSCDDCSKDKLTTDLSEKDYWETIPEEVYFPESIHKDSPLYNKVYIDKEDKLSHIWDYKMLNIYKIKNVRTGDIGFYVSTPTWGCGEHIMSITMGRYYDNLKDLISDYYSNRRKNWTEAAFYAGDSGDIRKNREDFEVLRISKEELEKYIKGELIEGTCYHTLKEE